jgi:hypothetical protein
VATVHRTVATARHEERKREHAPRVT